MINLKTAFMFLSALCFTLAACGHTIPVDSMVSAKTAIEKAEEVKADRYAPEDIGAAEKLLYDSHTSIVEEDLRKAKEQSEEAAKLAEKAYETSLPLLAADTIEAADQALDKADAAAAEILAEDEFRDARFRLQMARDFYKDEEFHNSYLAALGSIRGSGNAENLAVGRRGELESAIIEVSSTLRAAEKYGALSRDPETYRLAVNHLEKAEELYENLELKQGFTEIDYAKLNADRLYMAALSESARERVSESGELLEKAEESDGYIYQAASGEFEAAAEAGENARSLLIDGKYREAIAAADESIRLSNIVINTARPEISVAEAKPRDEKDYWIYEVEYRKDISRKDCLWFIADNFYKNPRKWPKIYGANRDLIKDPDLIHPGWKLKIPKNDH